MCIAILAKEGKHLTDEQLQTCWTNNPNGAGFAYVKDEQLVIVKELLNFEKFKKLYKKHIERAVDSPMLVHFRVRTHGDISIPNTQPIRIDNDTAFIHNGVISCVATHKSHSDTVMFSLKVLRRLKRGFHNHTEILDLIDNVVGYSKLVFLATDKSYGIVGEKRGDWEEDIWYSNTTHKMFKIEKKSSTNVPVGNSDVWRGHCQTRFPYAPDRLQLASTSPSGSGNRVIGGVYSTTSKVANRQTEVELVDGLVCQSCEKPFVIAEQWYEYFGKHMVCYSCHAMSKRFNLKDPTATGVIVPRKAIVVGVVQNIHDNPNKTMFGVDREIDDLYREAYGCGI